MRRWLVTFLVGVVIVGVAGQDWAVKAKFQTSVNLTCADHIVDTDTARRAISLHWILPTGDLVGVGMEHSRVRVLAGGHTLEVRSVGEDDFGVYYCLLTHLGKPTYRIVRKGININGPYWGDLLPAYRVNIIVGAIAAAVVAVIMLACCFLYDRNIKRGSYIETKDFEMALQRDHHDRYLGQTNVTQTPHEVKAAMSDAGYDNLALDKEETKARLPGNGSPQDHTNEPTTHL